LPGFYVIVGSGPGSWKKSTPLSWDERLLFGFIAATLAAAAASIIAGIVYCVYKATLSLRRAKHEQVG